MDKEKIYEAAKSSLSKDLTQQTKADASVINEAIAAAFEEYDKQR